MITAVTGRIHPQAEIARVVFADTPVKLLSLDYAVILCKVAHGLLINVVKHRERLVRIYPDPDSRSNSFFAFIVTCRAARFVEADLVSTRLITTPSIILKSGKRSY